MSESIQDGTTGSYRAKVNSNNQLCVLASAIPFSHYNSHIHKTAFSLVAQQTPSGANKAFVYVLNTDSRDMDLWEICLRCAAIEAVELWSVTGTAVGTAYTPVNMYIGTGTQAQTTCKVGNDITGLTKVSLIKRYWLEAGKQTNNILQSGLIIQESSAFAFYAVTGSALTDVNLAFDFHAPL